MANKTQKPIKRSTGDWMYCSFQAHPEEIAKWRELADEDDRSLSWWIRNQLNKAAVSAAEVSKGESDAHHDENVLLENVSSDRSRTDLEG